MPPKQFNPRWDQIEENGIWEISTYFYLYRHIRIQYIKTKENQWLLKFYVQRQKNTQFQTHYLMSSHYLILMGNTDSWKYYPFSMSLARRALSFKITTSDKNKTKNMCHIILCSFSFNLKKKSNFKSSAWKTKYTSRFNNL